MDPTDLEVIRLFWLDDNISLEIVKRKLLPETTEHLEIAIKAYIRGTEHLLIFLELEKELSEWKENFTRNLDRINLPFFVKKFNKDRYL